MTYSKNVWKDQDVQRPRTYEVINNQDGSITLNDSFGVVTEIGTPVNATNMNHIENGIQANDIAIGAINDKIPSSASSSNKMAVASDIAAINTALTSKANTDLSNLSVTGQAVIDNKTNIALDNLSIAGNNRLHALKGYEDAKIGEREALKTEYRQGSGKGDLYGYRYTIDISDLYPRGYFELNVVVADGNSESTEATFADPEVQAIIDSIVISALEG